MNCLRLSLTLLFLVGLHLASGLACAAEDKVAPALQNRLTITGPEEKIPVIVRMKESLDVQLLAVPTNRRGQLRANARATLVKSLKIRANENRKSLANAVQRHGVAKTRDLWLINGMAFEATQALIEELSLLPEVASISLDQVIELPLPGVSQITGPAEANIEQVRAPDLWALGYAGQGVTVAIVDSGVDINHPDLGPRWRGGSNSWFDPNGEHPTVPTDNPEGHGTQVTGLVLGGNNSGTYIGVAPEAQWIGVKIFKDDGSSLMSAIHAGYQWLLDPDGNPATDDAPDIVNNSWGFENAPDNCSLAAREFQPDIQVLKAAGVAVVFAAGNTGPATSSSVAPANYPESFAVGSIGTGVSTTLISDFSARGPSACDGTIYPEVIAPGFHVWTSDWTAGGVFPDSYILTFGTSYSTPHVSGVMALLLSAFPGVPVDVLESTLMQSATDLGPFGPDNAYGYGLVDALSAFNALTGQQGISVTDSVSPETDHLVAFGEVLPGAQATASVNVRNTGSIPLQLDAVDTSQLAAPFSVVTDNCSNILLAAGSSCSVGLRFAPSTVGDFTGSLTIVSSVIGQERVMVTLTGTGQLTTEKSIRITDSVNPENDDLVAFGQIAPNTSKGASLWVQNTGASVVTMGQTDTSLLLPPFSVVSDGCSNRALIAAEICTIDVRFAPVLPGDYSGRLDILSDVAGMERVPISLTGAGNTPPIAPQPLSPAAGATVASPVTFSWLPATDADGDAVAQFLVYSTESDFATATTVQVATVSAVLLGSSGFLVLFALFGGLACKRYRLAMAAIVSGLLLLMVACGGGGGSGDDSNTVPVNAQSTTVSGLTPGTTYYWKMIARDSRGAETQSAVRTLLVQ